MRGAAGWDPAAGPELARRWGVPAVRLFEEVGSTNDVARQLAAEGAPAGSVVVAARQSAGRGRGGKPWESAAGLGLWMSVLLRPTLPAQLPLIPLLVGLAVAEVLESVTAPVPVMLKWPNDLLLEGRKVCGILCEGAIDGSGRSAVVAGVGINVGHRAGDFPAELRDRATSVRLVTGRAPELMNLAGRAAGAILRRAAAPPGQLGGAALAELARRDALLGKEVRIEGAEPLEGVALGINPGGALLVRSGGALRAVHAGTVRLLGPPVPPAPRG